MKSSVLLPATTEFIAAVKTMQPEEAKQFFLDMLKLGQYDEVEKIAAVAAARKGGRK